MYSLLLIGPNGKTAAQVQATMPPVYRYTHLPPAPPVVSATRSRVYYADGSSIRYLLPGGSKGMSMQYPGGAQSVAGFAVSPDDKRGHLIVAVGPAVTGNAPINPYNGFQGYHVADAATGNRLVTMSSDCLFGPLEPTGCLLL